MLNGLPNATVPPTRGDYRGVGLPMTNRTHPPGGLDREATVSRGSNCAALLEGGVIVHLPDGPLRQDISKVPPQTVEDGAKCLGIPPEWRREGTGCQGIPLHFAAQGLTRTSRS